METGCAGAMNFVGVNAQGKVGCVGISVLHYETASPARPSSADRLVCQVRVSTELYSASLSATCSAAGLRRFCDQLRHSLAQSSGVAALESDDGALRLKVEVFPSGSSSTSGLVQVPGRPETALCFSFGGTEFALRAECAELEAACFTYPERIGSI